MKCNTLCLQPAEWNTNLVCKRILIMEADKVTVVVVSCASSALFTGQL